MVSFSAADAIVLFVVVVVLAAAVRSLRKGGVSDCSTCSGSCGGCSAGCSTPKIQLTPAQQERLRVIKAKGERH